MPNYVFYCDVCDESDEAYFDFNAKHEMTCECGNQMRKTILSTGVIFRGSGWAGKS